MGAKWIWENATPQNDEYGDFRTVFSVREGAKVILRISADSNYAAYINGKLAAFGQFADFPHCKVYDEVDVSEFCCAWSNTLSVFVWYYGNPSLVYYPGQAGVWFEVESDGVLTAVSGEDTLCRADIHYIPHRAKKITGQLGFSFCYDASADADVPLHPAILTGYEAELHPRPNDKLILEEMRVGRRIGGDGVTHFLLDVGCEEVGFFSIMLRSEEKQTITVTWGEHIEDGGVRRIIGPRDFSLEYITAPGENVYMNPFRRLGCRYLEIFAEKPIQLHKAGIVPTVYPLREIPFNAGSPLRQAIYDVCVRTLRLCMHEHYEDCPWREQALYAMDSRNQIISGYYAFGEYRFPRACLWLMAQDRRDDGLLAITVPSGVDLTIPSFSLHYFIEVLEYTKYSGDLSLAREIWPKLTSVLNVFTSRMQEGLIPTFTEKEHWNFYEWTDGLSGQLRIIEDARFDLLLNCLAVRAIDAMAELAKLCGLPFDGAAAKEIRAAVRHRFFLPEEGVFIDFEDGHHISELGNSLAILAGIAAGEDAAALAAKLAAQSIGAVQTSLSMRCFLYDALLMADHDRYAPWILADIEAIYKPMLDAGATSVWEHGTSSEKSGPASSLCHGWSAMPMYYYHILLGNADSSI